MTVDSTIQRIARLTPLNAILASLQSRVVAVTPRRTPLSQGLGAQVSGAVLAENVQPAQCPPRPIALRDGFAVAAAAIADGGLTLANGERLKADLIVVNGNPLENLKVLYPTGVDDIKNGKPVHTGGVEWTIKDGIPYHGPTLMAEVKQLVAKARAERATKADRTDKSERNR